MKKIYEWYIYKEKEKKQLRVILFVRFRNPHVSIHITLTSLTLKPSRFDRSPCIRNIGLRPYLEKLKIRVETRHTWVWLPLYLYILNIYLCTHFLDNILNEPELFFFSHTVKWFQVFLSYMNNSIYSQSFVCIVKWFQILLHNSNNLTSVICLHTFK